MPKCSAVTFCLHQGQLQYSRQSPTVTVSSSVKWGVWESNMTWENIRVTFFFLNIKVKDRLLNFDKRSYALAKYLLIIFYYFLDFFPEVLKKQVISSYNYT